MHLAFTLLTTFAIVATALASPLALASPSKPAPPKFAIVIGPVPSQVELESSMRRTSQAHEAKQFAQAMEGNAQDITFVSMTGTYTFQCPHGVVRGRFSTNFPEKNDPCGLPYPWAR